MRFRTMIAVGVVALAAAMIPSGMVFAAGHTTHKTHTYAFSSSGQGTNQSLSPSGCQNTPAGCTVKTTGTANDGKLGRNRPYTETLTIDWAAYYSNGNHGACAPASGPSVLTTRRGQLHLQNTGTVCEVTPSTPTRHVYFGTFTITGGTGHLATASGSGLAYGGDNGVATSAYVAFGTVTY